MTEDIIEIVRERGPLHEAGLHVCIGSVLCNGWIELNTWNGYKVAEFRDETILRQYVRDKGYILTKGES